MARGLGLLAVVCGMLLPVVARAADPKHDKPGPVRVTVGRGHGWWSCHGGSSGIVAEPTCVADPMNDPTIATATSST